MQITQFATPSFEPSYSPNRAVNYIPEARDTLERISPEEFTPTQQLVLQLLLKGDFNDLQLDSFDSEDLDLVVDLLTTMIDMGMIEPDLNDDPLALIDWDEAIEIDHQGRVTQASQEAIAEEEMVSVNPATSHVTTSERLSVPPTTIAVFRSSISDMILQYNPSRPKQAQILFKTLRDRMRSLNRPADLVEIIRNIHK